MGQESRNADRDPTPLLLVGKFRAHREALAEALGRRTHLQVVPVCEEAFSTSYQGCSPALIICDLAGTNSVSQIDKVVAAGRGATVIAIGVQPTEELIVSCAEAGARGIIPVDASIEQVALELRRALSGEVPVSPDVAGILLDRIAQVARKARLREIPTLSPREADILDGIARGLKNKEIARDCHISLSTVKNHVQRILRKLGVSNRFEAAAVWRTQGIAEWRD
jgi:two-component system, NarL family, nitrate/nitrite response regulator NarL